MAGARELLDRDPNLVNAQYYWYQFPLHMAVREGNADVVELLLGADADAGESLDRHAREWIGADCTAA